MSQVQLRINCLILSTMWHAQRNVIVPYLVLCQLLFVKASQRCRTEYSINGMMLQRHTFKKIKTTSWPECVKACNNDVRCQSTNYVINEAICELNNRTKKAKPEDFVADRDHTYMTRLSQRGTYIPPPPHPFLLG